MALHANKTIASFFFSALLSPKYNETCYSTAASVAMVTVVTVMLCTVMAESVVSRPASQSGVYGECSPKWCKRREEQDYIGEKNDSYREATSPWRPGHYTLCYML